MAIELQTKKTTDIHKLDVEPNNFWAPIFAFIEDDSLPEDEKFERLLDLIQTQERTDLLSLKHTVDVLTHNYSGKTFTLLEQYPLEVQSNSTLRSIFNIVSIVPNSERLRVEKESLLSWTIKAIKSGHLTQDIITDLTFKYRDSDFLWSDKDDQIHTSAIEMYNDASREVEKESLVLRAKKAITHQISEKEIVRGLILLCWESDNFLYLGHEKIQETADDVYAQAKIEVINHEVLRLEKYAKMLPRQLNKTVFIDLIKKKVSWFFDENQKDTIANQVYSKISETGAEAQNLLEYKIKQ